MPLLKVNADVRTLHLHHVNGNLLLSHTEDFKVGDDALTRIKTRKQVLALGCYWAGAYFAWSSLSLRFYLCSFRSSVHFHTEVIAISLPV